MGSVRSSRLGSLLCAAAALAGATFVAVPAARATCGNYLALHDRLAAHGNGGMVAFEPARPRAPMNERQSATTAMGEPIGGPAGHGPCRGPECRRSPNLPFSPLPPPVVTGGGEQLGLLGERLLPPGVDESGVTTAGSRESRAGWKRRVERPPRVLSAAL